MGTVTQIPDDAVCFLLRANSLRKSMSPSLLQAISKQSDSVGYLTLERQVDYEKKTLKTQLYSTRKLTFYHMLPLPVSVYTFGGDRGVTVINVRNGSGDLSSNPERDCISYSANILAKGWLVGWLVGWLGFMAYGGARDIMVIITGYGHGDPSSIPGQD